MIRSGDGCDSASELENYPLARAYRWRACRDWRARSLEWHLENDAPSLPTAEETEFQKERRLFYELRAERRRVVPEVRRKYDEQRKRRSCPG